MSTLILFSDYDFVSSIPENSRLDDSSDAAGAIGLSSGRDRLWVSDVFQPSIFGTRKLLLLFGADIRNASIMSTLRREAV
ncbi:hypothetical protein LOC67_18290 [Stieleria sp. JC731]|uniref:hypothetical protein n=1 Tax=Stieleria sp. JC731 TaxID=2894195 RepID=UPI001E4BCF98|nr:hypothetical protein [Stieleria sp. JC731]MCC9602505.1 hypothetical protein [Stieleria sp. JC731]